MKRIKLKHFNNLAKALSFNLYFFSYSPSFLRKSGEKKYQAFFKKNYSAARLTKVLKVLTTLMGAQILNISKQDFEPMGTSLAILLGEKKLLSQKELFHLDKSHASLHTYPDITSSSDIFIFRIDLDISTCGKISPFNALNYILETFSADVVELDYKVRGFTRDSKNKKIYCDDVFSSLKKNINKKIKTCYYWQENSASVPHTFHLKGKRKKIDLKKHSLEKENNLTLKEKKILEKKILLEMEEIFYNKNFL